MSCARNWRLRGRCYSIFRILISDIKGCLLNGSEVLGGSRPADPYLANSKLLEFKSGKPAERRLYKVLFIKTLLAGRIIGISHRGEPIKTKSSCDVFTGISPCKSELF